MNNEAPGKQFSAFIPVCLIAISMLILLAWNLVVVNNQHRAGRQISAQQEAQMAQAGQVEAKLKQMMLDLVDLAKTDTDAETIVKRYNISFTQPAATTAAPPISQ